MRSMCVKIAGGWSTQLAQSGFTMATVW